MGEVYKARDTRLDRTVAVKIGSERFSERFEREARAIAALNHPHICALYDIGPNYLVMEYIDGTPLQGPLPVDRALPLALQIAAALQEAHQKGITHRDLKPPNILVTVSGVKLLDFGLAKMAQVSGLCDATVTETQVGTVLGTAAYMSPEQASGKSVDARSDIFSFGAVLYEMISGKRAFSGETAVTTMAAVLHKEPDAFDAQPDLAQIVARCLRKSPAERYQTAAELKAALAAIRPGVAAPSIAVLPFVNMSADKENEYFSDGLSEEIINALTKIPGLRVIARTSAFRFRGEQDLRKVGEALQVATVLEGSVRKSGNRLRITAQLIKVADDSHIWSERYDRELTDIFAIQDEIAAAIVDRLRLSLSGRTLVKRPTANLVAYEAVLEGDHYWNKFSPENAAKARECFERAVRLDPNYAEAHVRLSHCYSQMAGMGVADPRLALPKARIAIKRALELDPDLPEAHWAMALSVLWLDYDWVSAERYCLRALALGASSVVRSGYGHMYLRPKGKLEEALVEIEHALEQDPLSPLNWSTKGFTHLSQRRFEAAADSCRRALELDPAFSLALTILAAALGHQRKFSEALAVANQALQLLGRWPMPLQALANVHAIAGNSDEAHRVLQELQEQGRTRYVGASYIASIYSQLGEKDAAFEWAERAIEQNDPQITWIKVQLSYDSLRSDSRYPALLRKLNLA